MGTIEEKRPESFRRRMIRRLRFGLGARRGFTLIELLVVITIIAVLCTIAIPTFLGQRQHAQDAATYSLVRNALTAIQGAFVDTGDYTQLTAAGLHAIEPSINFIKSDQDLVSTTPAAISNAIVARAANNEVEFFAQAGSIIDLASKSDSGNLYGIQINAVDLGNSGYVKVKVVEGSANLGW